MNSLWKIEDAIQFARTIEERIAPQYHVALAGGCLLRGFSDKDVDLIFYPHTTLATAEPDLILKDAGLTVVQKCEFKYVGKTVFECEQDGKRIDIFFLQ